MSEIPTYNDTPASIQMRPDNFHVKGQLNAKRINDMRTGQNGQTKRTARRPYSGIALKEDTFAVLSVIGQDNTPIPLVAPNYEDDSSAVNEYTDFILQTVQEQRVEKQQVVQTFGEDYIFFYGEQPRMITISGVLLSTQDYNWRSQFWHNYDQYFRGTQLVQMNARAYLAFDTMVIEGYPIQASAQDNSENPHIIQFSMQMFVTNYFDYSGVGSFYKTPEGLTTGRHAKNVNELPPQMRELIAAERLSVYPEREGGVSLEELVLNLNRRQVELYTNRWRYNLLESLNITNRRWEDNFHGRFPEKSVLEETYYKLHDAFLAMGGVVDDLTKLSSSLQRKFAFLTAVSFGPLASAIAAASDPNFTAEFYLGPYLNDLSGLSQGAIDVITAAASGKPDEAAAAAAEAAGKSMLLGRVVNPVTNAIRAFSPVPPSVNTLVEGSTRTKGLTERQSGFVGYSGDRTFDQLRSDIQASIEAGEVVDVDVGDYYQSLKYRARADLPAEYERVYGDRDYDGAVNSDATLGETLEQAYGDKDSTRNYSREMFEDEPDTVTPVASFAPYGPAGSEINPVSIETAYKTGVSSRYRDRVEVVIKRLRASGVRLPGESGTEGIRGIGDANSDDIEPIA